MKKSIIYSAFLYLLFIGRAEAQNNNIVTSAVPFLRISSDVRSSGMGDAGIATTADAYASFRNLSKAVFAEKKTGVAASFTPWMGDVSDGIYLAGLTGYHKLGTTQALSASLRYFKLGDAQLSDDNGNRIGNSSPVEFAIDAGYTRKLSESFSMGIAIRYIHSKMLNGNYNGTDYNAANAIAGDLSFYYRRKKSNNDIFAGGITLTDLGSKINYTNNPNADNFLPANAGIGVSYTFALENRSSIMIQMEGNKLLVPQAPVDSSKMDNYRNTGIVKSWFDSFKKENGGFTSAQLSVGVEAVIQDLVSLRTGYVIDGRHRNDERDSRGFVTFGAGLKIKGLHFDLSYLAAPSIGVGGNPAANTFRFGTSFYFN